MMRRQSQKPGYPVDSIVVSYILRAIDYIAIIEENFGKSLEVKNKSGRDFLSLFLLFLSLFSPRAASAETIMVLAMSCNKHCLNVCIYSYLQDINNPFPHCALFGNAFLKMKFNCPVKSN